MQQQLALRADRPLVLTYVVVTGLGFGFGFGATFTVFAYFEPLLSETAGLAATGMTYDLFIFGVGTVFGNLAGGALSDRNGTTSDIRTALSGLIVSFNAIAVTAHQPPGMVVTVCGWGVFEFLVSPAVRAHSVDLATHLDAQKAAQWTQYRRIQRRDRPRIVGRRHSR